MTKRAVASYNTKVWVFSSSDIINNKSWLWRPSRLVRRLLFSYIIQLERANNLYLYIESCWKAMRTLEMGAILPLINGSELPAVYVYDRSIYNLVFPSLRVRTPQTCTIPLGRLGVFHDPKDNERAGISPTKIFSFFIDAETFWRPVFLTPIFLLRCPFPVNDTYINPSRHWIF